jgi:hypothetical protein
LRRIAARAGLGKGNQREGTNNGGAIGCGGRDRGDSQIGGT